MEDRRLIQDTIEDLEARMRGDAVELGAATYDRVYGCAIDCLVAAARQRRLMRSDENVVASLLRSYIEAERDANMGADGPPASWLARLKRTAQAEAEDPEWPKLNL